MWDWNDVLYCACCYVGTKVEWQFWGFIEWDNSNCLNLFYGLLFGCMVSWFLIRMKKVGHTGFEGWKSSLVRNIKDGGGKK